MYWASCFRITHKSTRTPYPYCSVSVVSVTDSYGRILGFLDRSRYCFFQASPQLYSRGWVDPVPDPLLLRKSGNAGNRTRTSGFAARNSDYWTLLYFNFGLLLRKLQYKWFAILLQCDRTERRWWQLAVSVTAQGLSRCGPVLQPEAAPEGRRHEEQPQ
jgi:hypothetical protein